jgi:thioredoxin reductase
MAAWWRELLTRGTLSAIDPQLAAPGDPVVNKSNMTPFSTPTSNRACAVAWATGHHQRDHHLYCEHGPLLSCAGFGFMAVDGTTGPQCVRSLGDSPWAAPHCSPQTCWQPWRRRHDPPARHHRRWLAGCAAVQLRRSGIAFLLFEKGRIGGLLNEAQRVENFPGVPGGLPGRTLALRLKRQLSAAAIQVEPTAVIGLAFRDGRFTVRTAERSLVAERVILACGTVPVPSGPPLDAERFRGRLFTGILPLLKIAGETVAVIGGGDAACDYALSLAEKNRVHILVRSGHARALPLLFERCRRQPRIVIHENTRLTHAEPGQGGAGIILKTANALDGRCGEIACQRILLAVGRAPALDLLDVELRAALDGWVGKQKIFLAGDVANGRFRQAAIAAADGLRAAMAIQAEVGGCR